MARASMANNHKIVPPLSAGLGLLLGLLMSGCTLSRPPVAADVACDGRPNWCIIVGNEVLRDRGVYIDGQKVATAPAQGSVKVPLLAGESHQINYCWERGSSDMFGLFSDAKIVCNIPTTVVLDGNQTKVLYDSAMY